jgi:hypothetical protein
MSKVVAKTFDGKEATSIVLTVLPDTCPRCHRGVDAVRRVGFFARQDAAVVDFVFQCPRNGCGRLFIAEYWRHDGLGLTYRLGRVVPLEFARLEFAKEIGEVSGDFVEIYNQAAAAEAYGLTLVAGPGYGKALEFLVKDYAIRVESDKAEEIKKEFLGSAIKKYVHDQSVRSMAELAAWLRNDESHYERRWSDKDLSDLKVLIQLTVNAVANSELMRKYQADMRGA